MRKVDDHANGLIVRGYVGIGENARGNRNHELFFINGRVMHSKILNEAVETACRERVMIGRFPVCALYLTIAYEAVDVNVHPNKLEVRFRDEAAVYEAVLSAVVMALKENDAFERPVEMLLDRNPAREEKPAPAPVSAEERIPVPLAPAVVSISDTLPEAAAGYTERPKAEPEYREAVPRAASFSEQIRSDILAAKPVPDPAPVMQEKAEQINTILPGVQKPMKVFGALFNTFILVEYEDQLLLVDQHAVHERILFDRLMKEHSGGTQAGQELLVPIVIGVTNREQRLLEDNRETLKASDWWRKRSVRRISPYGRSR